MTPGQLFARALQDAPTEWTDSSLAPACIAFVWRSDGDGYWYPAIVADEERRHETLWRHPTIRVHVDELYPALD